MPLTGLHSLGTAYQTELRTFLRKVEGLFALPYFDSAQPPLVTIGIGTQIDTEPTYLAYVLQELGINGLPSETNPTQTANQVVKTAMDLVPNGSVNNTTLQNALDNALRTNFPSLFPNNSGILHPFSLTDAQAYTVLDKVIAQKQPALDAKLAAYGINAASMYGTTEYLALTSLNFNTKAGPTDLIGGGLRNAIANNDRAEAWFEIRYNSNSGALNPVPRADAAGLAKRRYYEAELFGLYGQGTPAGEMDAENLGVFRMLTRHRATIDSYEGRYGVKLDGTVGTRNMIAEANSATQGYGLTGTAYEIDTLSVSLQPARTYLTSNYGEGITINGDLLIGEDVTTLYYKGSDADLLTGTTNNDLLFGESGHDLLTGGQGSDVLYGGEAATPSWAAWVTTSSSAAWVTTS
jgi:GH24 family phage-related lysozyme (muramidase)